MKNRYIKAGMNLASRQRELGELLDTPAETREEGFSAQLTAAKSAVQAAQTEVELAALAEPDVPEHREEKSEDRELRELRSASTFSSYLTAAIGRTAVSGPELEYNQHCGIPADHFPLEFLADEAEERAAVDGDAGRNQSSWIQRLFSGTAAAQLGVSMPSVAPGISAYPILGSDADPKQRGRTQASVDATISATVTEIKPTRSAVSATYSVEDNARLPGFADVIGRDLRGAMTEKIDRTIFVGDDGANEAGADIAGFNTATGVTELTLTQANKVKADEVLKAFAGLVDGKYATTLEDLRLVASVGSNQLWLGTIHNSAASNQTIAEFLRTNGVTWTTRGDIEAATGNGKFGGFIGLQRGIANTAVAPVWSAAQLITDPYTGARKGEVTLTLSYLWGFAIPRTANYRRLKYVT